MAGPHPTANVPSWVRLLLGLQVALGASYAFAELAELPHYHDSNAYFELARVLRVDAHRGIAYPAFLSLIAWLTDGPGGSSSLLRVIDNEHPGAPCTAPDAIVLLQLLQLALCAGAFVYWLRTRDAPSKGLGAASWTLPCAVAALLLFDPLIAHFALSVMPDALAMAASLVFCGGLARVVIRGDALPRDGTLLFVGFVAASLLRPEKKYVLLCAVLASGAAWLWIARRGSLAPRLPARLAIAGGIVALALTASIATERLVFADYGRPAQGRVILHARLIFPHLGDIFDALPAVVQDRFTPSDVAFYDRHVLNPGPVMERVTRGDDAEAARLTDVMARTAWRERGGAIVLDTLKDGLENALPSAGLYPRLIALEALDVPGYRRLSRSDMLPWTHKLMTEHHPRLAHASLLLSGLVFALFAVRGVVQWRRRSTSEPTIERLAPWVPAIAFALANAAAFALHADAVSPRYTVTSHAMLLAAIYASALARPPRS